MENTCAWTDCSKEGTFPAPTHPRDLGNRQFFCQKHIAQFNKQWNGLDGMSEDEIYSMQDTTTWDRPTWKFGSRTASSSSAPFEFDKAEDLYSFFKQRKKEEALAKENGTGAADNTNNKSVPPDVQEACALFSIEPPFTSKNLKSKYLTLVKKHHPDVNHGSKKAEDHVKKLNVAYQILNNYNN